MQLTTEVREALAIHRHTREVTDDSNRLRSYEAVSLADEMLRLFPPSYFDEITPERLIAAGFEKQSYLCKYRCRESSQVVIEIALNPLACWFYGFLLPNRLLPRNMGKVLELVERCKEPKQ